MGIILGDPGEVASSKIYDTFDESAVKNPGKCLFSCDHVIVCDFLDVVYLLIFFL